MSIRAAARTKEDDADLLRVLADAVDDERASTRGWSIEARWMEPTILTVDVAIFDDTVLEWLVEKLQETAKGS